MIKSELVRSRTHLVYKNILPAELVCMYNHPNIYRRFPADDQMEWHLCLSLNSILRIVFRLTLISATFRFQLVIIRAFSLRCRAEIRFASIVLAIVTKNGFIVLNTSNSNSANRHSALHAMVQIFSKHS